MMKKISPILFFFGISLSVFAQYNVITYSGSGSAGFANGDTSAATFKLPFGICTDKAGNIYVADGGNNCIRKITPLGVVSTYAGTGVAGYHDGAATTAMFSSPSDICVDDTGNILVSDFSNQRIRKITIGGTVSTIAGNGTAGYMDGTALTAQFNYPRGICVDKHGNIFIGDSWNHRIREIDTVGNVTTYAGGGSSMGVGSVGALVNASDTSARFYTPSGLAMDGSGNIYVADAYNHRIRKIDTSRNVTTFCGSGPTGPGNGGYNDGIATSAIFNTPTEVFSDSLGNLLIGDTFNNRIRRVGTSGNATTIAGAGSAGFINGTGAVAEFNYTRGITSNPNGSKIYVVDYNNNAIRLITGEIWDDIEGIKVPEESVIKAYPNPTLGILTFEIKNIGGKELNNIEVYNILGQQVYSSSTHYLQFTIDLHNQTSGVYFYKAVANDGNLLGIGKIILL